MYIIHPIWGICQRSLGAKSCLVLIIIKANQKKRKKEKEKEKQWKNYYFLRKMPFSYSKSGKDSKLHFLFWRGILKNMHKKTNSNSEKNDHLSLWAFLNRGWTFFFFGKWYFFPRQKIEFSKSIYFSGMIFSEKKKAILFHNWNA